MTYQTDLEANTEDILAEVEDLEVGLGAVATALANIDALVATRRSSFVSPLVPAHVGVVPEGFDLAGKRTTREGAFVPTASLHTGDVREALTRAIAGSGLGRLGFPLDESYLRISVPFVSGTPHTLAQAIQAAHDNLLANYNIAND